MTVVLLESCPKEAVREREQNWIDFYSDTYGLGCLMNLVIEVDSGERMHTPEMRAQLSKRGRERWSGEGNPFHGTSRAGETNPFHGRQHSEETRQRISDAAKARAARGDIYWTGKHHTSETKEKIRRARLGRKLSPEARRAISDRQRGVPIKALWKAVAQIDCVTGEVIRRFPSITLAAEETGVDGTSISRVCRGVIARGHPTRSAGGFVWRYLDDQGNPIPPSPTTPS